MTGIFGPSSNPHCPKNEKINNVFLEEINEVSSDHENSNKQISSSSGGNEESKEEDSQNILIMNG